MTNTEIQQALKTFSIDAMQVALERVGVRLLREGNTLVGPGWSLRVIKSGNAPMWASDRVMTDAEALIFCMQLTNK
jgi:hypothetical protein